MIPITPYGIAPAAPLDARIRFATHSGSTAMPAVLVEQMGHRHLRQETYPAHA